MSCPIQPHVHAARAPGAFARVWDAAWRDSGREGCSEPFEFRVTETYYRPFVRARISFEAVPLQGRRTRYLFCQLFPTLEAAERRLATALKHKQPRRTFGPPFFLVKEWNAVVWTLPGGPRLRIVRSCTQRKAFRRMLQRAGLDYELPQQFERPHLLRYVPRKRAVFRWQPPGTDSPLFIKLYQPGGDKLAAEHLKWLASRRGALFFSAPELVVHVPYRRAIFMEGLPGETLTERYAVLDVAAMEATGASLDSLHGLAPELEHSWSAGDQLAAVQRGMEDIKVALPDLAPRVSALLARLSQSLERRGTAPAVPIHGNFFGDQVLVDRSAGALRIGIVDWDDLGLGDAEFDLARLIAHVRFRALQAGSDQDDLVRALRNGYQRSGRAVDEELLDWYLAGCLMMRAKISALRKLAPDWQMLVEACLKAAEARFDVGS